MWCSNSWAFHRHRQAWTLWYRERSGTKHRVHVRPRVVPNEFSAIRVTPNVYTTLEEIDVFSRAVMHAATKGIA